MKTICVADCENNRVQLFIIDNWMASQSQEVRHRIQQFHSHVQVESFWNAHKYLFIVDFENNRIVGSGPNGWRCLVGCYEPGSRSNQLSLPFAVSFDRSGNMYVTDYGNHRIQKFELLKDSSGKFDLVE
jgi:hypothetical protein